METNTQEELKAHLMDTEPEFRRLADEHAMLKAQLEAIEAKAGFTLEDEVEESRLKKLKLKLKDQMSALIAQHATHQAA